jgi:hypothetical protein
MSLIILVRHCPPLHPTHVFAGHEVDVDDDDDDEWETDADFVVRPVSPPSTLCQEKNPIFDFFFSSTSTGQA